jgi:hypothetical protein
MYVGTVLIRFAFIVLIAFHIITILILRIRFVSCIPDQAYT